MVALPGYNGPSANALTFTVGAVQCAIDVYYDRVTPAGRIVLAELYRDGLWHFLGDFTQSALMTVPVTGQTSETPALWITAASDPVAMVYPHVPQINAILAVEFPAGAGRSAVSGDVTIPSAGVLSGMTVTINESSPPVVGHT